MRAKSTVAEAVSRWPERLEVEAQGTAQRLLHAMRQAQTSPPQAGPGDLAGLVGQWMREEVQSGLSPDLRLKVPIAAGWPEEAGWAQHGLEVTVQGPGWRLLRALPWQPDWLPGAADHAPLAATLRREVRRKDTPVTADPVWADLLGQSCYLSPGQREAVRAVMLLPAGQSLLVVLPTGAGKSLVAHAPALLHAEEGGTTLLVVPTVALALDQERRVQQLLQQRNGGPVLPLAYHGGLSSAEKQALRDRVAQGSQPLIIASPESVVQGLRGSLLRCARRGSLKALILDEAHLIAQWGAEFRPDFQVLSGVRRLLMKASPEKQALKTVLLTATLTQEGWRTLQTLFGSPTLSVVAATHLRPEPDYWVAPPSPLQEAHVLETLRWAPRPLILYTSLREAAEAWVERLRQHGVLRVGLLHGGTPPEARAQAIEAWVLGEIDLMVATSAFGLGMDQADVRTIIHACVPETLDRFYQEVGRAGRDGRACLSFLLPGPDDVALAQELNQQRVIGLQKGLARWKQMYDEALPHSQDERLLVSLEARPTQVVGDSDANVSWNLRTLMLMARAELIELDAVEPPPRQPAAEESEAEAEARWQRALEAYALRMAVRPTGLAHLDAETWQRQVGPVRQRSLAAEHHSLEQVLSFMQGKAPLSDLLVDAYTVDTGVLHIRPTPVRGQCPVSRGSGTTKPHYLPPLPQHCGPVFTELAPPLQDLRARWGRVCLFSAPPLQALGPDRWREGLLSLLRLLVHQGVRELRVSAAWRALPGYQWLYRDAKPRIVFHADLSEDGSELSDSLEVPRLSVVEPGMPLLRLWGDVAASRRPLDWLWVAEEVADPERADRRWGEVCPHVSLTRLRAELT
jgi:ATP-dependent DNA helicase RecQ